jgi:hypothetical protein
MKKNKKVKPPLSWNSNKTLFLFIYYDGWRGYGGIQLPDYTVVKMYGKDDGLVAIW